MNFLRRALAKHEPTGLSILPPPAARSHDVGVIHEDHVERIIEPAARSATRTWSST